MLLSISMLLGLLCCVPFSLSHISLFFFCLFSNLCLSFSNDLSTPSYFFFCIICYLYRCLSSVLACITYIFYIFKCVDLYVYIFYLHICRYLLNVGRVYNGCQRITIQHERVFFNRIYCVLR